MPFREQHIGHFTTLRGLKLPRAQRVLAVMVLIGLVLVGAFLAFVPWVQTASGTGQVIAQHPADRVQDMTAMISGRIERWYVADGQRVRAGDPIVQISDNDPQLLERLTAERAQIDAQIAAIRSARAIAAIDVNRTHALYAEGLAARRDYETARIKLAELDARIAEAQASRNQLDINLSRQSAQIVRAPRDGVIQRTNGGDKATQVSQGDVLASFAPVEAERVVELYVDGRDVPLVSPGQPVRLEFEGWPAIQFSGWPAVARGVFDGRVRSLDLASSPNGLFRVLVEQDPNKAPWPRQPYVRLGATARGWILMEEVKVGFELWRQLNDFPLQPPVGSQPGTAQSARGADAR